MVAEKFVMTSRKESSAALKENCRIMRNIFDNFKFNMLSFSELKTVLYLAFKGTFRPQAQKNI